MPGTPAARPIGGPSLRDLSREQLTGYFTDTWNTYETLFRGVPDADAPEAYGARVHPFRLPLVFYLAHTAAFSMRKLAMAGLVDDSETSGFDERMERGVSPEDPDELAGLTDWPSPETAWAYRKRVRGIVLRAIKNVPLSSTVEPNAPLRALLMAIEHENIHLHTSIPLIRMVPSRLKETPHGWPAPVRERAGALVAFDRGDGSGFVPCRGGTVEYGTPHPEADGFRWDNEWGRREAEVAPFAVAPHPVTNGQYLRFVEDGGYERADLWTTHGARLFLDRVSDGVPNSWLRADAGTYRYRGVFADTDMPWDWPVEVSRHEAVAYANWAGAALLSEEQFHALLQQEFGGTEQVANRIGDFNVGLRHGSPRPVRARGAVLGRGGTDFVGNVALWLRDDFTPLDGGTFRADPLYPDFSEPWFGRETGLLAGASYAARGHMADIGVMRDFMQNHMDQLAGILLTRPAP
ncbi:MULTISPECIES: SUMF1/EgtB/PvdO family nonheme iron enzyme [unclassified Streptomyces]|uniref:SUMF1/EgtB/PvdO family nonheme iron enzyme n=1 Tax=unclassified Streptomyces TaxID=2593676 RepID=UPI00136BB33B|nr:MULTISPECIES: SUMF1/EgtB/PvdO family nonheme iron enzyme [unclassified Streptomyces]NEA04124.1 SUMF1/EgtB/PvdO family nonheme iron enzyme [Streptomyces sp. SID10116]MYY85752.1 SUMF1/EgtB/PvdO family nonheme iron enzyme [Streptomyces sp. SID335]MYZ15869.1 SUMF1/EgtB/PvdO family nonheme iron enzyme [Streptomyces sp. SID337]NDZ90227.1 SUMF1/EgtB/PvdO family nonheme iron enzyme [Streptomyces sp. SID10115]NEB46802.1 SUMF1/EgtB/PvdO family nonheme iron enzyme [Streptomyces sp. SID339]